jgi:thiamine biosynthesis lipoprotein
MRRTRCVRCCSHMVFAHALIDTGETALLGQSPRAQDWRFAIPGHCAFSTSRTCSEYAWLGSSHLGRCAHGVQQRPCASPYFESAYRRFAHLWASVSVIAPSCALADALTKVFFMCPPQDVERTAKAWGVGVVLQDKRGEWLNYSPQHRT